jgi:MSHA biogenesis protein MshN
MKDLAAGHTAQGMAALRRALAIDPQLVPARLLLAGFEAKAGKLQSALSILNAGFALGAGRLSLARLKARILVTAGQIDQAIGVLERNAPSVNNDPAYHALLAGLEVRSGHYRRAAQQYAALLPLNPDKAVWWLGLAIALDQSRQKPAARKAYRAALAHPGLSPTAQAYARRRLKALQGEKG